MLHRGKIRHHHIGTGPEAFFPSQGIHRTQSRCGGKQNLWQQNAQQGQQHHSPIGRRRIIIPETGILLRNKRADADHMGLQLPQKQKILRQGIIALTRRLHHKSGPYLVPDFLQIIQAPLPVLQAELRGVQLPVMPFRRRFVTEQITVRTGFKQPLIRIPAPLSNGKGHRTVGKSSLYLRYQGTQPAIRKVSVLPALQDKGAKAQPMAFPAAVQDFLFGQAVSPGVFVVPAQTAVITIVSAIAGKFDQPPEIHFLSIIPFPQLIGCKTKFLPVLRRCLFTKKSNHPGKLPPACSIHPI